MIVIFRPHCGKCGYEFEEIHGGVDDKSPFGAKFDPPCCPQCKADLKSIVYFITNHDEIFFNYRKESADDYAKELEDANNRK